MTHEITSRRAAVFVVAALLLALIAGGIGFGVADRASRTEFESTVTNLSSSGRSLCIDRAEDDCGFPIVLPEDRTAIKPGAPVFVRELWLDDGNVRTLAFAVRPR